MSSVTVSVAKSQAFKNVVLSLYQPLNLYPTFVGASGFVILLPDSISVIDGTKLPPFDSKSTLYKSSVFINIKSIHVLDGLASLVGLISILNFDSLISWVSPVIKLKILIFTNLYPSGILLSNIEISDRPG